MNLSHDQGFHMVVCFFFYYPIEVLGHAEVFQQQSACLIIVIFLRTLYALEIKSLRLYKMNFTSHKFA